MIQNLQWYGKTIGKKSLPKAKTYPTQFAIPLCENIYLNILVIF